MYNYKRDRITIRHQQNQSDILLYAQLVTYGFVTCMGKLSTNTVKNQLKETSERSTLQIKQNKPITSVAMVL